MFVAQMYNTIEQRWYNTSKIQNSKKNDKILLTDQYVLNI